MEILGKKCSKIWLYLASLSIFLEISEKLSKNIVPLAMGNFHKFKPEFSVEWKAALKGPLTHKKVLLQQLKGCQFDFKCFDAKNQVSYN